MKLKLLLLIMPFLGICGVAMANPLKDSIGVENLDGKKVILHKLDPKDSYYSIGRRYNVKPQDIIKFNNNVALRIGGIIKVPTDRSVIETTPPPVRTEPVKTAPVQTVPQPQKPVQTQPSQGRQYTQVEPSVATGNSSANTQQYKVSQGETLFAIARRFNTTVEDLINLNGLKSNSLTPGQILLVKASAPTPPPVTPVADMPIARRDSTELTHTDSVERRLPSNRYGLYEKNEKGVATYMDDAGLDPNKMLALHRFAPIGTVVKVTNPMTNRSTFAKVVGRFTDSEATRDVIIVVTKNAATALGAIDKRFYVNVSYGTPNE